MAIAQTPNLHFPYGECTCAESSQGAEAICWIVSIEHCASINIFIDPEFHVFFVLCPTESKASSSLADLFVNIIDKEVLTASIPSVGSHEADFRLDGKHKGIQGALKTVCLSYWSALEGTEFISGFFSFTILLYVFYEKKPMASVS